MAPEERNLPCMPFKERRPKGWTECHSTDGCDVSGGNGPTAWPRPHTMHPTHCNGSRLDVPDEDSVSISHTIFPGWYVIRNAREGKCLHIVKHVWCIVSQAVISFCHEICLTAYILMKDQRRAQYVLPHDSQILYSAPVKCLPSKTMQALERFTRTKTCT
jgi:hypothetical protein